jgi:hypothetical protein
MKRIYLIILFGSMLTALVIYVAHTYFLPPKFYTVNTPAVLLIFFILVIICFVLLASTAIPAFSERQKLTLANTKKCERLVTTWFSIMGVAIFVGLIFVLFVMAKHYSAKTFQISLYAWLIVSNGSSLFAMYRIRKFLQDKKKESLFDRKF